MKILVKSTWQSLKSLRLTNNAMKTKVVVYGDDATLLGAIS